MSDERGDAYGLITERSDGVFRSLRKEVKK
jgi:hypothetical protein